MCTWRAQKDGGNTQFAVCMQQNTQQAFGFGDVLQRCLHIRSDNRLCVQQPNSHAFLLYRRAHANIAGGLGASWWVASHFNDSCETLRIFRNGLRAVGPAHGATAAAHLLSFFFFFSSLN